MCVFPYLCIHRLDFTFRVKTSLVACESVSALTFYMKLALYSHHTFLCYIHIFINLLYCHSYHVGSFMQTKP